MWNKFGSGSYRGVDLVESLNHKNYHNFYRKSYRLPATLSKSGKRSKRGKWSHYPKVVNDRIGETIENVKQIALSKGGKRSRWPTHGVKWQKRTHATTTPDQNLQSLFVVDVLRPKTAMSARLLSKRKVGMDLKEAKQTREFNFDPKPPTETLEQKIWKNTRNMRFKIQDLRF